MSTGDEEMRTHARPYQSDPELGLGPQPATGRHRERTNHSTRSGGSPEGSGPGRHVSPVAHAMLVFTLVMFVLGVLPAYMVLWFAIVFAVLACVRARINAGLALEEYEAVHGRSSAGVPGRMYPMVPRTPGEPVVRLLPGGGMLIFNTNPHAAIDHINLQLRSLEREVAVMDYEAFLRQQHGAGASNRPPPVSETDLAALPVHLYKPKSGSNSSVSAGGGAACSNLGDGALSGTGSGSFRGSQHASSSCASSVHDGGSDGDGHSGLTCPVCLDGVAEGAPVMTLPCMHQFHRDCIVPWLRQQGAGATCPMCKTTVFR